MSMGKGTIVQWLNLASPAAQDDIAAERLGEAPSPGGVAGGGSAG